MGVGQRPKNKCACLNWASKCWFVIRRGGGEVGSTGRHAMRVLHIPPPLFRQLDFYAIWSMVFLLHGCMILYYSDSNSRMAEISTRMTPMFSLMERDALGETSCSKSKAPFTLFCTALSVLLAAKLQMLVDVVIAPVLVIISW